jgi:hypothetical protein
MATRDEAARKAEARAFSDQVDALVSATVRGDPPPADASEDAVRLAAAFVLLDRVVSQYAMLPLAANEGAVEAQKALLALRSGYDHPLWSYVTGIRTKYRLNRKASPEDLRRRAYSVGLMRALEKINGNTGRAAAKALSEHDYYRRYGVTFAALRHWPEDLQEPPALDLADTWCRDLVANARGGDDAVQRTVTALQTIEGKDRVPSLAAAARKRPLYAKFVDKTGQLLAEVEVHAKK